MDVDRQVARERPEANNLRVPTESKEEPHVRLTLALELANLSANKSAGGPEGERLPSCCCEAGGPVEANDGRKDQATRQLPRSCSPRAARPRKSRGEIPAGSQVVQRLSESCPTLSGSCPEAEMMLLTPRKRSGLIVLATTDGVAPQKRLSKLPRTRPASIASSRNRRRWRPNRPMLVQFGQLFADLAEHGRKLAQIGHARPNLAKFGQHSRQAGPNGSSLL